MEVTVSVAEGAMLFKSYVGRRTRCPELNDISLSSTSLNTRRGKESRHRELCHPGFGWHLRLHQEKVKSKIAARHWDKALDFACARATMVLLRHIARVKPVMSRRSRSVQSFAIDYKARGAPDRPWTFGIIVQEAGVYVPGTCRRLRLMATFDHTWNDGTVWTYLHFDVSCE